MRVFNIKETGKTRGRLISGGAYTGCIFLFTGRWAYNRGGGGGDCKRLGLKVAVNGIYVFITIIRGSEALPKPCLLLGL